MARKLLILFQKQKSANPAQVLGQKLTLRSDVAGFPQFAVTNL
jgi:hypothetical protein